MSAPLRPRPLLLLGGTDDDRLAALLTELGRAGGAVRTGPLRSLAAERLPEGAVLVLPLLGLLDGAVATARLCRESRPGVPLLVVVDEIDAREAVALMRLGSVDVVFLEEGGAAALEAADRLAPGPDARALGHVPAAPAPVAAMPGFPARPPAPPGAGRPVSVVNPTVAPPPRPASAPPAPTPSVVPPPAPGGPPAIRRPLEGPELPILDERTVRLQELIQSEDASFPQVEEFVAQEPTLVAALLRTANSAYYRTPKLITNLHDAVVRVGVRHSLTLILQWLLARAFAVPGTEAQARLRAVWANATLTARLTRRLAEWEGCARPDDAYLAGLLHNVGEAVLVWELYRPGGVVGPARFAAEGPRIVLHHEAVGRTATERWGLPPLVQGLAGHHHHARVGEPPRDAQLRLATIAAWNLARELLGEYLDGQPEADSAAALDALGLSPTSRQRLARECALAVADMGRVR